MGVGHAAVALGASRWAPRVNAGWLVFAALLADFLLGIFAALGLEQAHIPANYSTGHYLTFTFPWSHGLVPLLVWGALLGLLVSRGERRAFVVISALVVSHYLLDGIVHVAGLPLLGEGSPKVGLGLWKNMPLELAIETALAAVGVSIYLSATRSAARWGVVALMLILTAGTWTPMFATTAPSTAQMIPGWIGLPLVFSALIYVLDRRRAVV